MHLFSIKLMLDEALYLPGCLHKMVVMILRIKVTMMVD